MKTRTNAKKALAFDRLRGEIQRLSRSGGLRFAVMRGGMRAIDRSSAGDFPASRVEVSLLSPLFSSLQKNDRVGAQVDE